MRLVVAGLTPEGRSTIVSDEEVALDADGPSIELWSTTDSPPTVPGLPPGPAREIGAAPGTTAWRLWRPPAGDQPFHRTDTISYSTVLAGALDLLLEEGRVSLEVGDCIVILGVIHGWRVAAGGARLACMTLGIEPPA